MTSATAESASSALPPALPKARRAPSLWRAGVLIFDLSLARMLWSRGTIFMGLLVGLPVILALLVRGVQAVAAQDMRVEGQVITGPTIFGFMVWWLYLRFIVPVLALYYGTALVADEVEDKTITYLFTRPIPRSAVLIGKYLAYLASTVLIVLPSVMLVYFLIVVNFQSWLDPFIILMALPGALAGILWALFVKIGRAHV